MNCGIIYLARKDYHNGYIYFNDSIEYNDENGKAFFGKAECLSYYLCIENLNEAITCYEQSLKLLGSSDMTKDKIEKASKQIQNAKIKNYYQILDIENNDIDLNKLDKIYKKKALKWHPDRHSSEILPEVRYASSQFSAINEAYNTLKDENKRKEYNGKIKVSNYINDIKRVNKITEKEKKKKEYIIIILENMYHLWNIIIYILLD